MLPGTYTETSHSGDVLTAFGYTQTEYEEDIGYIMRNNGVTMMEAHEIFKERLNFLIFMYENRGFSRADAVSRARESKGVI